MLKNHPSRVLSPMVGAFLIREYDDDRGEWTQVGTDNLDARHEVLLLPREKHTIGSLIHFLNILGFDADIAPCTILNGVLDTSAWLVDYDPDGSDINAYRLSVG